MKTYLYIEATIPEPSVTRMDEPIGFMHRIVRATSISAAYSGGFKLQQVFRCVNRLAFVNGYVVRIRGAKNATAICKRYTRSITVGRKR